MQLMTSFKRIGLILAVIVPFSGGTNAQSIPGFNLAGLVDLGAMEQFGSGSGLSSGNGIFDTNALTTLGDRYFSADNVEVTTTNLLSLTSTSLSSPDSVLTPFLNLLTGVGFEFFPLGGVLANDPGSLPDYLANGGDIFTDSVAIVPVPDFTLTGF